MLVAGIDCSSKNIALTILNEKKEIVFNSYIESNLKDMDGRLEALMWEFEGIIKKSPFSKCELLAVENPVYLSNPKASSGIAQVIGYCKSTAIRNKIYTIGVDNRSWKKSV